MSHHGWEGNDLEDARETIAALTAENARLRAAPEMAGHTWCKLERALAAEARLATAVGLLRTARQILDGSCATGWLAAYEELLPSAQPAAPARAEEVKGVGTVRRDGPNWPCGCPVVGRAGGSHSCPKPARSEDTKKREPGCECHWEEGDSPCVVHGLYEAEAPARAEATWCAKCNSTKPCPGCTVARREAAK